MVTAVPISLGVMFCDVVGSTRLYRELGDHRAHLTVYDRLSEIGRLITERGGRVIKTIGDEVMATFPDAVGSFDAAVAIQTNRSAITDIGLASDEAVRFRIGFHCGPVLCCDGDVFGTTVNVAARLAALAKADQIMTTAATVDRLDASRRAATRLIAGAHARGLDDDTTVAEVIWQKNSTPQTVVFALAGHSIETLKIFYEGRSQTLDQRVTSITLGRASENTIVLQAECVSRRHATLERRGNRWLLIDHSTNGTYVQPVGTLEYRICREELFLNARGTISLGQSIDKHRGAAIEFALNVSA